jgi:hypothetical protein
MCPSSQSAAYVFLFIWCAACSSYPLPLTWESSMCWCWSFWHRRFSRFYLAHQNIQSPARHLKCV